MTEVKWGKPASAKVKRQSDFNALDSFVNSKKAKQIKRLNSDIPAALYTQVKADSALEGKDITEVVVEFIR